MAFECFLCDRKFEEKAQYENHLIKSPRHYYCKICQKDFVSETARRDHIAHARKHQTCPWCEGEFEDLKQHNNSKHERCWQCDEWFKNLASFHAHGCSKHKKKYCLFCRKVFKTKNDYEMHRLSSCHLTLSFKCPSEECHTYYISESALVAHLESGSCLSGIDQSIVDQTFIQCDTSKKFIRVGRVAPPKIHQISMDQAEEYPCSLCPKKLNSRGALLQHLNSSKHTNNGREPYKCPIPSCKKAPFPSLSGLLLHHQTAKCKIHQNFSRVTLARILNNMFQELRTK